MSRHITGEVDEHGFPYLNIAVADEKSNTAYAIRAIIDTGSAFTLIKPKIAEAIFLPVSGRAKMHHPTSGAIESNVYKLTLVFPEFNVPFTARELNSLNYPSDVIIGIDFLKWCSFSYDGQKRSFKLTLLI